MKTIKDILSMVWRENCCKEDNTKVNCTKCSLQNYCGVSSKLIAIDYLNRGEYYG